MQKVNLLGSCILLAKLIQLLGFCNLRNFFNLLEKLWLPHFLPQKSLFQRQYIFLKKLAAMSLKLTNINNYTIDFNSGYATIGLI